MIEIITTSLFVLSSIYGGATTTPVDVNTTPTTTAPGVSSRIEEQIIKKIPTSKEIEQEARAFFKKDPILVDIARCESSFTHLDENGNVIRGKVNKGDVGLMQINEYYHAAKAKALGFDLESLEGNMAYAMYLYDHEGGQPWISSSKCWNNTASKSGEQVAINN